MSGVELGTMSQGRRDTLGLVSNAALGTAMLGTFGNIHFGDAGAIGLGAAGMAAGAGWSYLSASRGWRRRAERPEEVTRLGLIQVLEGRQIFPNLTVEENLAVARTARGSHAARFELDDVFSLFPPLADLRHRGGWAL